MCRFLVPKLTKFRALSGYFLGINAALVGRIGGRPNAARISNIIMRLEREGVKKA